MADRAAANKELVRHIIQEGFNRGNLDVADGRFTDDYTAHVPGVPGGHHGPDAFKRVIGMWRGAFDDLHMTIEHLVAEGDYVANHFTTRGTHSGMLFGQQPTGRSIVVESQELHRLSDGLVAETWVCNDVPSIVMQLGLDMPKGPPA